MCFWMPAAVLSTFPQFFQRHLNITFMEFCRGEGGTVKGNEPANAVGQHAASFLLTRSSSRPHSTGGRSHAREEALCLCLNKEAVLLKSTSTCCARG